MRAGADGALESASGHFQTAELRAVLHKQTFAKRLRPCLLWGIFRRKGGVNAHKTVRAQSYGALLDRYEGCSRGAW